MPITQVLGLSSICLSPSTASKLRYFRARFFGFAFGVNGAGGVLSRFRSNASVRFFASAFGRNSRESISSCAVFSLVPLMMEVSPWMMN